MAPKPVMATAQDLKDAESTLTAELARVQSLIEPAVDRCSKALRPAIQAVDQKATANSQLAAQELQKAAAEAKKLHK